MKTSRKERRAYEKFLKKSDPERYKQYKKDVIKNGKEIHRRNVSENL